MENKTINASRTFSIFKAYDIRGIYGADFTEETAYRIAFAYAQIRKEELGTVSGINIAVGRDMRVSSPSLMQKIIDGLLDSGMNVIDIGLASTPTFYFSVANYGYDGGILVSASHNPKEYNGFKMVRDRALPVSKDTGIYAIRDIALDLEPELAGIRGKLTQNTSVLSDQVRHDLRFADLSAIKKLKIAIDPANSMGAQYFDELFKNMPDIELVKINWELDGTFPAHEADPFKPENMEQLSGVVRDSGADIGIATDGDGDRIFFMDETGAPVDPGITRAILCKIFLKENPGAKIAYDIRPGRITYDTIIENGGIPIVTRVGHSSNQRAGD